MADELTINARLAFQKGSLASTRDVRGATFDVSGNTFSWQVQEIGTTAEVLDINSDIATPGYAWFRNIDDTNFVEIGVQDGSSNFIAFAKLKPGEVALIRLATSSIYAKADTAAVKLEHWVVAD